MEDTYFTAMYAHADKTPQRPSFSSQQPSNIAKSQNYKNPQAAERRNARPEALAQLKLQELAATFSAQQPTIQRKENKTGLPDRLKAGIEHLSGYSLDDVNVHYNSAGPASLQAHAFAQGTDIHIAPGQERHLPHEAWHVVQQKQGRVKATKQLKGKTAINDDAGLEKEADVMGAKALQLKAVDEQVVQRAGSSSGKVVQLVQKKIGEDITDQQGVVNEIETTNTLAWANGRGADFSGEYGGSVRRALHWGQNTVEGTAGWTTRDYNPIEFHVLANMAGWASHALTEPELNNEKNKALIAIRTFRSSGQEDVAELTVKDLRKILKTVNDSKEELVREGLIPDASDTVAEIEADPAEAHPNTLPTAKITFETGNSMYFKGRSARVENAINGTWKSSARVISKLGRQDDWSDHAGIHAFLDNGTTHISDNVGPQEPRTTIDEKTALNGWISGLRTAMLAMLTGLSDLHSSNVIEGIGGKKHIIDGEFLLDIKSWRLYEQSEKTKGELPFDLEDMVPDRAMDFVKGLNEEERELFAEKVVEAFKSLGLGNEEVQEEVLAPIRQLIAGGQTLLRISPLPTDQWLNGVTSFLNAPDDGRAEVVKRQWRILKQLCDEDYGIQLNNGAAARAQLKDDFSKGRVPLLHIEAQSGDLYLDKRIVIGQTSPGHTINDYIDLIKRVVTIGHEREEFEWEITKLIRRVGKGT